MYPPADISIFIRVDKVVDLPCWSCPSQYLIASSHCGLSSPLFTFSSRSWNWRSPFSFIGVVNMLIGEEQRREPGEDTTLDSSVDARDADVVVALRLSSGRVTFAAAGVTLDGMRAWL